MEGRGWQRSFFVSYSTIHLLKMTQLRSWFEKMVSADILGQTQWFPTPKSWLKSVRYIHLKVCVCVYTIAECVYAWGRHSWNHIAAFFLFHLIPALVHYILVYTYYKQTIDPMHHANLLEDERFTAGVPSPSFRQRIACGGYSRIETNDRDGMTTARLHHAAPLTPRQRRAAQQAPYTQRTTITNGNSVASVAGPGPQTRRTFVSRGIKRNHRPPPLVSSPSPFGLNSTPGAPTYNRRPSRVYAAFAAPVESSEYDKFV